MPVYLMASLIAVFCFVLFAWSFKAVTAEIEQHLIGLGSSLSPINPTTAWYSSSGRFAFGFVSEGAGYRVGIYIVGTNKNITVWTANRDKPAVSSNAKIEFVDGKIVLKPEGQSVAASSQSELAKYASMLENGNFVLYNKNNDTIWQSFDLPTDSILGGQKLPSGHELISSSSPMDNSSGRFRLKMQDDGNLVAYPLYTKDDFIDAYWVKEPQVHSAISSFELRLNNVTGILSIVNLQYPQLPAEFRAPSSQSTKDVIYRATLDYDGNFRLYSHSFDNEGKFNTSIEWEAIADLCQVKSLCGYNSYCTRMDGKPHCICVPGFNFTDPNRMFGGCDRNFKSQRCIKGKENATLSNMTAADLAWDDHPYFAATAASRKEGCSMSCSVDCDCDAAIYTDSGSCLKYKLPLKYVKGSNTTSRQNVAIAFIKLSETIAGEINPGGDQEKEKTPWVIILILSLSFVTYSCIALGIFGMLILNLRIMTYRKQLLETGKTSLTNEFTLRTCTYNDLKKATNGFKEELGKGAFGAVYKGTFDKGNSFVAVKKLEKVVEEGEREFRAEMRVIGRTRHKNLVRLQGYCIEGSKRLLVYEYMSNGSLADFLFRARSLPYWEERVRIALDVAKGLYYLHEECETPIIHCDIKPQNILLDGFWTAKISDFGLAKLLMPDQTRTLTGARGTRGYMAPEWDKSIPISLKVDIYSFGIVLLEIVCCRRNLEINIVRPEATLLSFWAYECFAAMELDKLVAGEKVDKRAFERMIMVALWCIQDEPALRFPMKQVMLMLEGIIDVPIPPCPTANPNSQS